MAKVPFPPYQKRLLSPKIGAGMDSGPTKRSGFSTGHSMLGNLTGTDAYFRLAWVEAATHWGIGGALDGELDGAIFQWVEMGSNLVPWASGPWNPPGFEDGASFVERFGRQGINARSDSIELSGQLTTPVTVLQWHKFIWLLAAIAHDGGIDSETFEHFHHREFCTPAYKDCPFPRVYNSTKTYMSGVVKTMQFYEGAPMRDEFITIGKLKIPLPIHQGEQPKPPVEPPPDDKPIFVPFPKPRLAELWNCTERQYANTSAKIYDTYKDGARVWFSGYYNGQEVSGDRKWYVVESNRRGRIHSSGIKAWLPNEPEKLARFADIASKLPTDFKNADSAGSHWIA